ACCAARIRLPSPGSQFSFGSRHGSVVQGSAPAAARAEKLIPSVLYRRLAGNLPAELRPCERSHLDGGRRRLSHLVTFCGSALPLVYLDRADLIVNESVGTLYVLHAAGHADLG